MALFVCLVTKAIHLESVEDYTTAGFLAAFWSICESTRFIGLHVQR